MVKTMKQALLICTLTLLVTGMCVAMFGMYNWF